MADLSGALARIIATFSVACLRRVFELCGGMEALGPKLRFIFDSGPHFKAYNFIGTMALATYEQYGKEVDMTVGPENHFKNLCDGTFAICDAILS